MSDYRFNKIVNVANMFRKGELRTNANKQWYKRYHESD